MAISFNTAVSNTADTSASVAVTIPAGVLPGDVMVLGVLAFTETGTTPALAFSGGSAGAWTLVPVTAGTNPEVATAGSVIWSYGWAYTKTATAADAGATLTVTETGSAAGTTWMGAALGAYTGASATPDTAAGNNFQGANVSASTPAATTIAANDREIAVVAAGLPAGSGVTIAALTKRTAVATDAAGMGIGIWDGNSALGAGTVIGSRAVTGAAGGTDWYSLFTIALKPAAAAGTVVPDDSDAPWHLRRRHRR